MTSGGEPSRARSSTTGTVARRSSSAVLPRTRLKAVGQWPRRRIASATSRMYISDPARVASALFVKSIEIVRIGNRRLRHQPLDHRLDVCLVAEHGPVSTFPHARLA